MPSRNQRLSNLKSQQFNGMSIVSGNLTGKVEGSRSYRKAKALLSDAIREVD